MDQVKVCAAVVLRVCGLVLGVRVLRWLGGSADHVWNALREWKVSAVAAVRMHFFCTRCADHAAS